MGATCGVEQPRILKIIEYHAPDFDGKPFIKTEVKHDRFGYIEKLRTRTDGIYKLIMATNDAKMQTITIECPILTSAADFELYEGTKFDLEDKKYSPIFDVFDKQDSQTYHQIRTQSRHSYTLKVYNFTSYRDVALKNGIYEISLYQSLPSKPLVDYFIMSRGKLNALVMVFRYYQTSLFEVMEYRQQANKHYWTEIEILHIWRSLISSYLELNSCQIYHRDIRLSKIFYTPQNKNKPFQFVNLESARKITDDDSDDLLTVYGVNILAEDPIRKKIEAHEELANYDPYRYDLNCLINVLLSTLTLNTLQPRIGCNNILLSPIIDKLKSDIVDLKSVEKYIFELIKQKGAPAVDLFEDDRIISDMLVKSHLSRAYQDRINKSYLNTLILLHKKEEFNNILIGEMENSHQLKSKEKSIETLHKIGQYFEKIGVTNNEYYVEEIKMMLEVAQQLRKEYYYKEHGEYLAKAMDLYRKNNNRHNDIQIIISREKIYNLIQENNLDKANQELSVLLDSSTRSDGLDINIQISVFQTKIYVEILNKKFEAADNTIEKTNSSINSSSQYLSQYDLKRNRGDLQYLRGYYFLEMMQADRTQFKTKNIGLAEQSLSSALNIFINLPESRTNTLSIVNAYHLQASLFSMKEEFEKARKSLQSSEILLRDIESSARKSNDQRGVSPVILRKTLQQLKGVLNREDKEGHMYQLVAKRLDELNKRGEKSNSSVHSRNQEKALSEKREQHKKQMLNNQKPIMEQQGESDNEEQ